MSSDCSTMRAATAQDGSIVIGDHPMPQAGPRQLLVRVHATAINRADTLQRKGSYNPPPGETNILGLEMAGEVVAAGPECESGLQVGDRVMALLGSGGYAEFVAVDERQAMRIPDEFSYEQGAAIPETWLTAYQLLHFVAGVQEGDRVLVHAAASGVGTAAIQLAQAAGATVVGTAGSQAKLDHVLSLGAIAAINYKTTPNWSEQVLEATQGAGVSIILDCVGASHWEQNLASISVEGRWVVYGLLGGPNLEGNILGPILRKRIRIEGTTLRARPVEYKARLVAGLTELFPRFQSGDFTVHVDRTFNGLEELNDSHAYMESNANIGKIVVTVATPSSSEE